MSNLTHILSDILRDAVDAFWATDHDLFDCYMDSQEWLKACNAIEKRYGGKALNDAIYSCNMRIEAKFAAGWSCI